MAEFSLCMIVKNEEDVLSRCLESVKDIVDEIIIVDTGSTDETVNIARKYTKKVYDFKWVDDFAKARNYSFSKATKEFIIWLDADDVILKDDALLLIEQKKALSSKVDVVMMKYNVAFDQEGNPSLTYYRERILARRKKFKWESPIHEAITPTGNIIYSDVAITHRKEREADSDRNLNIFKGMIAKGQKFDARQRFYYARELYYNGKFNEAIVEFNNFLDSEEGWIENNISACLDLSNCYAKLNKQKQALQALFRSFQFDAPRSEVCCAIGYCFLNLNEFEKSIYWYKLATVNNYNESKMGFESPDCHDFIPYIQLCVCYDKLGNLNKSKEYHQKAKSVKPTHQSVLLNDKYFENMAIDVNLT